MSAMGPASGAHDRVRLVAYATALVAQRGHHDVSVSAARPLRHDDAIVLLIRRGARTVFVQPADDLVAVCVPSAGER